jgi:small subunit ribosomal protein S15e
MAKKVIRKPGKKKSTNNAPMGGGVKHKFKTYTFRGIELDDLVKLSTDEFSKLIRSRARRRISRGLGQKAAKFLVKCRKAKKLCQPGEKPPAVKTHNRSMIVLPEMIGNVVGVHNGHGFAGVEIKDDMVGHALGEFAITYVPIRHGKPGIGATHSSRFIPLK